MGLACVVATDASLRMFDSRAHYSDYGVISRADLIAMRHYPFDWYVSLHMANGEPWFQIAIFAAIIGVAGLLFVGFRSRWMCFALWSLVLSTQFRNPFITEGFDVYLRTLLLWGLFLPLGARFSLDSIGDGAQARPTTYLSVGTAALVAQIFIVYSATGLFKIRADTWLNGTAIENVLQLPYYTRPWGESLVGVPGLSAGLSYATLLIELGSPLLLLLPHRTYAGRLVSIAALASLHLGIAVLLDVGLFSCVSLAALCVLLPSEVWDHPKLQTSGAAVGRRVRALAEIRPLRQLLQRVQRLPSRIEPGVPTQALAAAVFALVLHYNVVSFPKPKSIPHYPHIILQPLLTLRLNQEWSMFANTTAPPHRFHFVWARTQDGRELNPMTNSPYHPVFTAGEYNRHLPSHRWTKLFIRVFRWPKLQQMYAAYLCRDEPEVSEVQFLAGHTTASLVGEQVYSCSTMR